MASREIELGVAQDEGFVLDTDRLARPQPSDRVDRLPQRADRLPALHSHGLQSAETRTETEDGAACADLVQRGRRHGDHGRMPCEGIGDAGPEAYGGREVRDVRQADVRVPVELLIGEPEVLEPMRFHQAGQPDRAVGGVFSEQQ